MTALLLAFLLQVPAARTQEIADGTLIVRQDTIEVAREAYRLVAGRLGSGLGAGAATGWTLTSTIRYDRVRPVVTLAPILEIGRDSLPVALQYDISDAREPIRILGTLSGGRFTVRFLSRGSERAREFLASGPTVVLDDSVFAPYVMAAWLARPTPTTVTAIVPRSLRRESLVIEDHGNASTLVNRETLTLRHVTVSGGPNHVVHLWLNGRSGIMKVEIPTRRFVVERAPSP
jgi:hypothetical protein